MGKKTTESEMLARLSVGAVLLPPLVIRHCEVFPENRPHSPDAYLELGLPDSDERFPFIVESKVRATPQGVKLALAEARAMARPGERPMVQVPFLSPERLEELEREQASGVDLCGNGIVIVPGRLWVVRSGHPNAYRDSRPLVNPYRGRSALVGRALLQHPSWSTLGGLVGWIRERGAALSLAQASKAIQAMEEDLLIVRRGGAIGLQEPQRMLDKLGQAWRTPSFSAQRLVKLPHGRASVARLSAIDTLKWVMTGESTVSRYVTFAQGGPRRVAVSNLAQALAALEAVPEAVPSFAEAELLETQEPGLYFGAVPDENGIRWASRLQTWLELQAGDARQREAAADLRPQILQEAQP
jgi:hypothetical protein